LVIPALSTKSDYLVTQHAKFYRVGKLRKSLFSINLKAEGLIRKAGSQENSGRVLCGDAADNMLVIVGVLRERRLRKLKDCPA
jgi:hypothetical protein